METPRLVDRALKHGRGLLVRQQFQEISTRALLLDHPCKLMCLVGYLLLQRSPRLVVAPKIQKGQGSLGRVHHRKCPDFRSETYAGVAALDTAREIPPGSMELHESKIVLLESEEIVPQLEALKESLSLLFEVSGRA